MNVTTILDEKGVDVVTTTPDATLLDVAKILREHRIGCVVVEDSKGGIAGIVSERDLIRAIAASGASILKAPVSRCMTKEVVTCQKSDTIEALMASMTAGRFRHLPVVDGEKLIGLVSIVDVVRSRIAETELEAAAMREYIATG